MVSFVAGVPPAILQVVALWLLLLALAIASASGASTRTAAGRAEPADDAGRCPFCGAPFSDRLGDRPCWCGADGHWMM